MSTRLDIPDDSSGVGPRLREIRKSQGLSLRAVADRSGLSVGFLSQVERGLSSIALSSLHSVADALGVSLAALFEARPQEPQVEDDGAVVFTITRAVDRPRRTVSSGRHYELLSARASGLVLEPMLVYIEPGGTREAAKPHAGEEFAYVLSGELMYEVAGEAHRLGPGDSLYLRSTAPHTFYNDGEVTTIVVSVVTPRHF
ncbi:HTH-type transcriptional regulator PuuR [Microbacterium lemovicicum]|uniref:HTH-type transcriptional regulator PuuR n=1 Tax=Microbacterium lemovicicum TaxID=1072463 RepID=A0A3S9W6J2_9MICO|nr:cupin domain-containing protein [Microbacterium lemovicicum]AZS35706.1 HTH-type transcriptional regulator PuuR [Microbacterium lemovicicum]